MSLIETVKNNWPLVVAAGAVWAMGINHIRNAFSYVKSFVVVTYYTTHGTWTPAWEQLRRTSRQVGGYNRRMESSEISVSGKRIRIGYSMPFSPSFWIGPYGPVLVNNENLIGIKGITKLEELVRDAIVAVNEVKLNGKSSRYASYQIKGTAGNTVEPHRKRGGTIAEQDGEKPMSSSGEPIAGVDRCLTHTPDQLDELLATDAFSGLHYPDYVYELRDDLDRWWKSREWHEARSIPWKYGVITEGPGGTGKSSFEVAMAKHLGIPIYQFHLGTMTSVEVIEAWENLNTPCVVSFGDFDAVFNGRTPMTEHKMLTFDTILNVMSGINSRTGVLHFVSTNHLEHIDEAMGRIDENGRPTRPGRINRIVTFGKTEEKQRRSMATQILDFVPASEVEDVVAKGEGTTADQFQKLCIQYAQEKIVELENLNKKVYHKGIAE